MRPFSNPRAPGFVLSMLLATGLIAVLGAACSQGGDEKAAWQPEPDPPAPSPDLYRMKGEIEELPDPDNPMRAFYVHHEAVDDFKNMEGEVVGMDAMTMSFPVAEDLPLDDFAAGDLVEFTLKVDWNGDPAIEVTEMAKLQPGTELVFRQASSAGPE